MHRALKIKCKLFGEEQSRTADSCHSLGATQYAQGDFSSALQSAQRALDIKRNLFGEEQRSTADSYHSPRAILNALSDFYSALQTSRLALDTDPLSTADS